MWIWKRKDWRPAQQWPPMEVVFFLQIVGSSASPLVPLSMIQIFLSSLPSHHFLTPLNHQTPCMHPYNLFISIFEQTQFIKNTLTKPPNRLIPSTYTHKPTKRERKKWFRVKKKNNKKKKKPKLKLRNPKQFLIRSLPETSKISSKLTQILPKPNPPQSLFKMGFESTTIVSGLCLCFVGFRWLCLCLCLCFDGGLYWGCCGCS